MSSVNQNVIASVSPYDSYQVDSNGIAAGLRALFTTNGVVTLAGATDDADLIAISTVAGNGTGLFQYIGGPGTRHGIASGPIDAGQVVYSDAAGQISAAQGFGHKIGRAITDAAGAGASLLWIPLSENGSVS